jgi:4-amino-4-deoxy-L-arabinose transferase-like glycosyltransferase
VEQAQGLHWQRLGWLAWLALMLAWFATIQVRPLTDPDEGRYAEIPREMLATGDFVTPRFNDLKYFEKPPLQYWGTAAVYSVAGVHEWSSRLWSTTLAFACLPMVFAWTARRYGYQAGLVALTALAVSPYFAVVSHLNLLDQAFTFWLSAAVFAFTLAQMSAHRSDAERRWMLIAWAAAALAVLSKGIVVGVLAGGALILYTLIERDTLTWRRLHLLVGVPLFTVIAAPWFILVSLRNPSFPGFFFVHEHFARFLTTVHQRVQPWYFFLPLLLLGVLPWVVPFVRALRPAWCDAALPADPTPSPGSPPFKPRKFLLIYAALTLVFFSASGSKLAPYILPMFPPLAVLTGAASRDRDLKAFARQAAWITAVLVLVVAAVLLIYSARKNAYVPHVAALWVAAGLASSLAAVVLTSAAAPAAPRAALITAVSSILAWQFLLCAYTLIPPARSARDLVVAVRPSIGAATALYSVGQYRETVSPYLGRTLQLVAFEGELQFGLSEEPARRMGLDEFVARWSAAGDAVAFFDPGVWDSLRRQGLPGRVLAADNFTVAVSRL